MKQQISIFIMMLICLNSFAQNYSDSLTIELSYHIKTSDIPGVSVAIVNDSKVLYAKGFGYADKEMNKVFSIKTIQNLGSVSKTIVGLALVKAIEQGKLTLDTKINDVLPFKVENPFFKDHDITIRQLANHSSTILDTKYYSNSYVLDGGFITDQNVNQDFLKFLKSHETLNLKGFLFRILNKKGKWYNKKNFLKKKPGSTKEYSNINAALTAYIVELATKKPFKQYTQETIFSPLNMAYTSWEGPKEFEKNLATGYFPKGSIVPRYKLITYPDGGLYSNTDDLSKFLKEIIKAFSEKSEYLKPEYAKLMLPGDSDKNRTFWGMGQKSRNIGHGGSDPGVQNDLQFNADSKIGRIILANVNAEDNDNIWKQYRKIHDIIAKYENKLNN